MKKYFIIILLIFTTFVFAQNIINKLGGNTANETYEVRNLGGTLLFQIQGDGGALFVNNAINGTIPMEGIGDRMMWYPAKGAFRVGFVDGTQWDDGNIGNYSIATGHNTTASNSYSTAMGASTIASAQNSTAMGSNTIANTANGVALGLFNTSSTNHLLSIGNGASDVSRNDAFVVTISGNVGIGTPSPDEHLHIDGNIRVDGTFEDKDGEAGTNGQILSSTGSGTNWINTPISYVLSFGGSLGDAHFGTYCIANADGDADGGITTSSSYKTKHIIPNSGNITKLSWIFANSTPANISILVNGVDKYSGVCPVQSGVNALNVPVIAGDYLEIICLAGGNPGGSTWNVYITN